MTFDEWWKKMKPAECDEVKEHFQEAWHDGYGKGVAAFHGASKTGARGMCRVGATVSPAPTFADVMAAKCHECGWVSGFHDKRCRGYLVDPETGEPIPTHNVQGNRPGAALCDRSG